MSRHRWCALVLVLAFAGNPSSLAQVPLSAALAPSELFEKVSPCVVKIVAKDEEGRAIGTGSGFAISPKPESDSSRTHQRWIVTNHHVVRAAVSVAIDPPFTKANELPAAVAESALIDFLGMGEVVNEVVAENKRNDLAVLAAFGWNVPHLTLGDDTVPPIGTRVFVISSPEGLKNTLSEGLISGFRERENGEQWIQITAPISPGSSGGPVLTTDGRVIGVVVASHEEGQNLNFAVPVSALRRLLDAKAERRPLWKGTSISKEESDAFDSARFDLNEKVCGIGHAFDDACAAKLRERAETGDQLALLLKARHQCGSAVQDDDQQIVCNAFPTLFRAVDAKPGDREYLARYFLGKNLSIPVRCMMCVTERKNWPTAPEMQQETRAKCYEPAISLLKKSTELNPRFSPTFKHLAATYLETERYPEALVAAEFLVSLVPNCWEAYLTRGKAFAHLKRIAAADEDFATAVRLRPACFELYQQVYNALSASDVREYHRAFDASKKALSLPLPTDPDELKSRQYSRLSLWHSMALDYERLGDFENAARAWEEVKQLSPGRISFPGIEEWIVHLRAGRPRNESP